ncbi:MAG: peptidoglycan binding domain-containing protein [Lachnospiraceae bacterium]
MKIPALQNQYQGMKHYLNTEVIYTFGKEKEALDGSIIEGWLLTDAEGNVSIDREKTAAYVADLAARRDTYDKSKEFKASDGTWILVSGEAMDGRLTRQRKSKRFSTIWKAVSGKPGLPSMPGRRTALKTVVWAEIMWK